MGSIVNVCRLQMLFAFIQVGNRKPQSLIFMIWNWQIYIFISCDYMSVAWMSDT